MSKLDKVVVEYVAIDSLKGWERNPRTISKEELEKLQRSLDHFGIVEPLLVRRSDMLIVGGHQRAKAASALGLVEVPVVFLDLSDAEMARLNVALNKISGSFDYDLLLPLLESIRTEAADSGLAFELTGFTEVELSDLITLSTRGTDASVGDGTGLSEGSGSGTGDSSVCSKCNRPF